MWQGGTWMTRWWGQLGRDRTAGPSSLWDLGDRRRPLLLDVLDDELEGLAWDEVVSVEESGLVRVIPVSESVGDASGLVSRLRDARGEQQKE